MDSLFNNIQHIIQNQMGMAFLAVFAAGLISAASPCVLAAIPLIIGYVGGYSEGNKKKAALYSLVFILGLSITFTLLGAAASAMGAFFSFMGRWLYLGLAVIAVVAWPRPASAQCGSSASSCKNCHEVQGQDAVNADGTGWHQSHAFGDFCYICHAGNNQSMDTALGKRKAARQPKFTKIQTTSGGASTEPASVPASKTASAKARR